MASVKVILYKSKKLKDGSHPLAIKVTKDRKVKYFFLKKSINSIHWDSYRGKVLRNHPQYRLINNLIAERWSELEQEYNDTKIQ
ncbi:MAG: Arm DNA-binding domain-containing protein [Bacteroidota bacterium]